MAANSEERISILKMIEEDKISAEEGLKLLEAIGNGKTISTPAEPQAPEAITSNGTRLFKVVVTNMNTGKVKTKVTIPLSIVDWGLRVGSHFSSDLNGINLEELSDLLKSEHAGKIIDVMDDEDGEHVEIYID